MDDLDVLESEIRTTLRRHAEALPIDDRPWRRVGASSAVDPPTNGRSRAVLVAALVVLGVGVGIASLGGGRATAPNTSITVTPVATVGATTTSSIASLDCTHGRGGGPVECVTTAEEATELVGIAAPTIGAPDGWVELVRTVRTYRPGGRAGTEPDREIRMHHVLWGPPGTDPAEPGSTWVRLDLRPVEPLDADVLTETTSTEVLGDGTVATGSIPDGGPTHLTWIRDGAWYRFEAHGLPPAQVRAIVDSVRP